MFLRSYKALLIAVFVGSTTAFGQTPSPSPTPVAAATPDVKDKQEVEPERLQGVPSISPNYRSDDRSQPDLGRVGVDMTDQQALTLAEAITKALENNKDIEVTRKNVQIAEFDLKAARGFYEPKFAGQTYYERAKTPVFNFFGGGPDFSLTQSNIVGNAGFNGAFRPTGATYSVTANNGRNTTNNLFTSVNPTYTSSLSFQFTQPILRGRSFDQPRRAIEIAKRNLSLTDTQFRQRTIETIATVQRAYWDLTYALRNLQVHRDGVKDAKDQLEYNKRLVDEGQLAPIDIVAAETQVANFEQFVYDAFNLVGVAENTLKNLIAPGRADAIWSKAITPIDSVDLDPPITTLAQALDAAMQNRPELEINQAQKDINALDKRYYKEQGKPQIDLVANYTLAGAAGTFNPNVVNPFSGTGTTETLNTLIRNNNILRLTNTGLSPVNEIPIVPTPSLPDELNGGYGSALGNLFANRYPTFRVGVQFNLPLFGDRTSKAQYGRALVEGERLDVQRQQLEQNIQVDVRNALQALRTAEARLRAAAISRENSVKQYESEQRKLDNGQSDIYKVLERQTALTTARSNELRAQTELNKSISDLQRATGNSLKANNIEARLRR
ncbi:MAG: TolC family protein [Acidobacteriota bacterium]